LKQTLRGTLLPIIALFLLSQISVRSQTKAPALSLRDTKGRTFRLSAHKGKVVLINFWATWCPPCRAEIPTLIRMQAEYRSQGLQIVGITYPPQKLSAVRKFAARLKINYPVAIGSTRTKLLFTESENLPITVVVDRAGNVVDIIEGILLPEEFESKIQPLIKAHSAANPEPALQDSGQTVSRPNQ
jgi:thiol-disulfide isomerase/thioredoxin